ncbi:MAG: hypothetical protein IT307_06475 [Chloroflexi bacterium]|nr:hypothetical protein [Chloroflexota bacterium]
MRSRAVDDGAETRRLWEMEAATRGRIRRFTLPAERFAGMSWPLEHLGAGAVVAPGMGLCDHARAAIQVLSGDVPERVEYGHLGWRKLPEGRAYLHAGGAIGAEGTLLDVAVRLPEVLARYVLPDPPSGEALQHAIRASLAVLDAAPAV